MSQNIPIQEKLKYIKIPILYVYSKKNCFVHIKHADYVHESLNQKPKEESTNNKASILSFFA